MNILNTLIAKLIVFTACILILCFLLYCLYISMQVGRYQVIEFPDRNTKCFYIDTATGKIYRIMGGRLYSSPHSSLPKETKKEPHREPIRDTVEVVITPPSEP